MTLLEEILEKRSELQDLERIYSEQTPPCKNVECNFYRPSYKQHGHCSWSVLVEDCREYMADV